MCPPAFKSLAILLRAIHRPFGAVLESGAFNASEATAKVLLITRADRGNYYSAAEVLFSRHVGIVSQDCQSLLDHLGWTTVEAWLLV